MSKGIDIIAFYLPQYYPIPENDAWWGKGFTEWTNVTKAKPMFPGHYQPKLPKDLGFYDLRVPETRMAQAEMARKYGIKAFCYWHYWFGDGKRLLNRPFDEVLKSGSPHFPFCLAWANATWRGFDYGCNNERNILIEQKYPGDKDYIDHFYSLLPAFKDERYYKIDGKPLFMIFQPAEIPNSKHFIDLWQKLAVLNGLNGIFFIAQTDSERKLDFFIDSGYDAVNLTRLFDSYNLGIPKFIRRIIDYFQLPKTISYKRATNYLIKKIDSDENCFPTVYPNWDHSARSGKKGLILHNSKPDLFKKYLQKMIQIVAGKSEDRRIIFVKSWNEWAEGNYLEPDRKYGLGYLEAIKESLEETND